MPTSRDKLSFPNASGQELASLQSFISLDQADHLLSRREDAEYVGAVIASWASRYLDAS